MKGAGPAEEPEAAPVVVAAAPAAPARKAERVDKR
jgi:hypothetical protein